MIFIKTGIVPAALKIGFFLVILFLCEQVYAADVTPPQLQSWDFTPKTVDVSSQAQVITVTFRVTDDLSGVVIPNVSASSDTTSQTTGFAQVSLISGNARRRLAGQDHHSRPVRSRTVEYQLVPVEGSEWQQHRLRTRGRLSYGIHGDGKSQQTHIYALAATLAGVE